MEVFATIKGNTVAKCGETVHLEGFNQFFPSIKYLKWQKYINGKYFDIDIHKSKYQGTRNYLPKPMLVINDIELEDGGTYRIEFRRTTEVLYSNVHRIKILPKEDAETMTINVHSDQRKGKYFVGENVIMKANIRNPAPILCMTWQKETETSSYTVNTSVPEYTETENLTNEHTLTMKNCLESDSGTYFLLAVCTANLIVYSNRVQLEVKKGRPFVSLTQVSAAFFNKCVQLKAAIRSFPKHDSVKWMKGKKYIDITQPKYDGSSDVGDSPILCINHIDRGDAARYKIKVHNEIGTSTCKIKKLEVNGEKPEVCLEMTGQSKKVPYGTSFTLRADVKSYPEPDIQWTREKDGCIEDINQKEGKFVVNSSNRNSPNLTIENFDFNDNGNYFITVSNEVDSVSDSVQLNVEVVQIKPTTIVSEGDTAHLNGMVPFHHSIRYVKWQKCLNEKFVDIDVHKPKYLGTTNVLQHPELVINDVDADDQVEYRLEVQMTKSKEYSNVETIKINRSKEISKIHVYSDQENDEYYVGEDVTIKANLENRAAVLSVSWQYATGNESYTIDSTLPKYAGTKTEIEQPQLIIRNCIETDRGLYFLLAASTDNMDDVFSNKINLKVKRDSPTVILKQVQEALYNTTVEIKAMIRSFPKHTGVIWMKGEEPIDIFQPKYIGSLNYGDRPVLKINNVKKEDKYIYSIKVSNELGEETRSNGILKVVGEKPLVVLEIASQTQSMTYGNTITLKATITSQPLPTHIDWEKDGKKIYSDGRKFIFDSSIEDGTQRLTIRCLDFDDSGKYTIIVTNELGATKKDISVNVTGNTMVFISGPVVVSSFAEIHLQTILSININNVQVEWLKTKNNITRKLDGNDDGITVNTQFHHHTIQTLEIKNASGYGGEYQLSLECSQVTLKSNKINVFIDDSSKFATEEEGNCLRFFALQSVCKDAMRRVLDNVPGTFQNKWSAFLQWYNLNKGKAKITLPSLPPTSSQDLDISLMYAMFRNTSIIGLPGKGWGKTPAINNTNKADDIERIRFHRNKISHGNSSKMTTNDFNESSLDLIMAIRRLTADDEQFIKQLSDILNKVFYKGSELEQMMEKLNDFRKLAAIEESILSGSEEAEDMTNENDEKAIYLTGRKEVFIGEMATIIAFIDPKISALSKIFWQRTDKQGYIHIIDINDGKYTGSTTKFPSPTLCIHFVRKDDEGTYRLFVDAFSKIVHNSVSLVVKEGECDETGNVEAPEDIGIHRVRDSNISLLHKNTIARKINGMDRNGVCFTNRPINVGENIYLRIAETHAYWTSSMDFGLTNKDPNDIVVPPTNSLADVRKAQIDEEFDILPDFNDVLCFTLNRNNTLSFSINGIEQPQRKLQYVSVKNPVWLSFDLWGRTRAIEISSKKKKRKPCNSYIREYLF